MPPKKSKAIASGAKEAVLEVVKLIPGTGVLIEGIRKYHESIEEQQREEFIHALSARVDELRQHAGWYTTEAGQRFVKKVVATALNAEHADKIEFLSNALVNGPKLGADDARRSKFVEMIRQLSKPALEVLAASLSHPTGTGQVMPGELAGHLRWPPELVDSCVRELYALGAYSSVKSWHKGAGSYSKSEYFDEGVPLSNTFTGAFAEFIK